MPIRSPCSEISPAPPQFGCAGKVKKRLLQRIFPVTGEFLPGRNARGDRARDAAGAGENDAVADLRRSRNAERQRIEIDRPERLHEAEAALLIEPQRVALHYMPAAEMQPDGFRLRDQIADGENQSVADQHAIARPLGSERIRGEGIRGNDRVNAHHRRQRMFQIEFVVVGARLRTGRDTPFWHRAHATDSPVRPASAYHMSESRTQVASLRIFRWLPSREWSTFPSSSGIMRTGERGFVSIGLIGLLDDIAALAKVAAASLDDVAGQAAKAGTKAAGVVIDDAAVTPRYVVGFAAARELPIVGKIAAGSLRNKLLILLPAALALNALLPAAITPLLMLGGLYLCYEGAEKIYAAIVPHQAHAHETTLGSVALDPQSVEDQRIASAIKTDFILSAEIMAITLASLPAGGFWMQAIVLALVGLGITIGVYGVVALIVKADDAGVALAGTTGPSIVAGILRASGRALVLGVPYFLTALSLIGTAAMVWVGGGIFIHGLETYGLHQPAHLLHAVSEAVATAMPAGGAAAGWIATAAGSGLIGLMLGALLIPVVGLVFAPAWRMLKQALPKRTEPAGN